MNGWLLSSPALAAVVIFTLSLLGTGFCVLLILLRAECEKNERLRDRNIFLRERLSDTQHELSRRGYQFPTEKKNG